MSYSKSFVEQYNHAKKTLQNAIDNGFSIVLCGKGKNGKTHLIELFKKELKKKGYVYMLCDDELEDDPSYYNIDNSTKLIIESQNSNFINNLHISEQCNGLVFINMNDFRYPGFTRLRSGRI